MQTPMRSSMRVATRVTALLAPIALLVASAGPAAADAPATWDNEENISKLDVLLIFGGIPLGLILVIGLYGLVTAERSTAAGHYYAYPQVDREALDTGSDSAPEAIESGESDRSPTGGASATW